MGGRNGGEGGEEGSKRGQRAKMIQLISFAKAVTTSAGYEDWSHTSGPLDLFYE